MSTSSRWWMTVVLTLVALLAWLVWACGREPVTSQPVEWAVAPATDASSDTVHLQVEVWQHPAPSEVDEVHVRESPEEVVITVTLRSRGWSMDRPDVLRYSDLEIIEVDLDEPLGDRDLTVGPRGAEPLRFRCLTEAGGGC